jgi:hypothetical protein
MQADYRRDGRLKCFERAPVVGVHDGPVLEVRDHPFDVSIHGFGFDVGADDCLTCWVRLVSSEVGQIPCPDRGTGDAQPGDAAKVPQFRRTKGTLVSAFAYLPGGDGCGSLQRVPDDPVPDDATGLRAANARLRAVVEAKGAENALLRAEGEVSVWLAREWSTRCG